MGTIKKAVTLSLFALTVVTAQVWADVIEINDFDDLLKIGVNPDYPLDGHYELTADIDAAPSRGMNEGKGFEPIGSRSELSPDLNAFTGIFDGKGFTVSGLYINRAESGDGQNIGLFGYTHGATVKNLTVAADSVIGYRSVGALVGRSSGGTIENCRVSGAVVGGSTSSIEIGGLAGMIESGSAVKACFSSASVEGPQGVGGLVGVNGDNVRELDGGAISECYTIGTVKASISGGGGMVGHNHLGGTITNSYSFAAVTGGNMIGGFVGENNQVATIMTSYSAGPVVSEGSGVGGFAGKNDGTINHCRWDTERSGQPDLSTGPTGFSGLSTADMTKSASLGWNFGPDAPWGISNNYPYLRAFPTYTMTFRATFGGTVAGDSVHVQIVNYGVDGMGVTAALIEETGESFDGWYLVKNTGPEEDDNGDGEDDGDNADDVDDTDNTDNADAKLESGEHEDGFTVAITGEDGVTIALSNLTADTAGVDIVIEARFVPKKYRITYIVDEERPGGKITAEGREPSDTLEFFVNYEGTVTVTAVPGENHNFSRWWFGVNDTAVTRTDTVTRDTTFYARFAPGMLTLTYRGGEDGIIRVNTGSTAFDTVSRSVAFGSDSQDSVQAYPVLAKMNTHIFVIWSDSVTDNPRRDLNVRENIDVYAIFLDTTTISIASNNREIPQTGYDEAATVYPTTANAVELTAGPNPASRSSGSMNFYLTGSTGFTGNLMIYDANGNRINKIAVNANTVSWDLKDFKGRPVIEGSYLVKGTVRTAGGKRHRVSTMVGIRDY